MAFAAGDQAKSTLPLASVASFDGASDVAGALLQLPAAGMVKDCCDEATDAQPLKNASTYHDTTPLVKVACSVVADVVPSGANGRPSIDAQTRYPFAPATAVQWKSTAEEASVAP